MSLKKLVWIDYFFFSGETLSYTSLRILTKGKQHNLLEFGESYCEDNGELSQLLNWLWFMAVIRDAPACCLWTIFSWHWVWTRLRLPVAEELAAEVSGICRFKGQASSTMSRFFFRAQMQKVPNFERWFLLRKHMLDFSVLLLEGSSNNSLIWNA